MKKIITFVLVIVTVLIMGYMVNDFSKETIQPGLTWSEEMGKMEWENASLTCSNLNSRLPNQKELVDALRNQFIEGGNNPGGFQKSEKYWSSSKEKIGKMYRVAVYNYENDLVTMPSKYNFNHLFRCVK